MEVPTKVSGEHPEITVLMSNAFEDVFKPFRCVVCGKIVFSYNNQYIRTIVPSGKPRVDRPQKIVECNGVISLNRPSDLHDMLFQVMDSVFNMTNIDEMREAIAQLAQGYGGERTARCKARYYI